MRDPRSALLAAGLVAGVLILQRLVSLLQQLVLTSTPSSVGPALLGFAYGVFVDALVFAVGVFVLLWLLPLRTVDRVLRVLGTGLAAAAAGTVLASIGGFVLTLGALGLLTARDLPYYGGPTPLVQLLPELLARAPLVMLVVLVLWVLRRTPHP